MREAERRGLPYLFKLRLTANIKKLIKKTFSKDDWTNAAQGWQGREDTLRLEGWSRQRQAVILRRLKDGIAIAGRDGAGQLALGFVEMCRARMPTNGVHLIGLEEEVLTLAQLCRNRADSENPFDELKNQWGWGGFTTRDLAAASSWRASLRSSTTGGSCSCGSPSLTGIWRLSPAGRCCFQLSQSAAAMRDRQR